MTKNDKGRTGGHQATPKTTDDQDYSTQANPQTLPKLAAAMGGSVVVLNV